MGRRRSRIREAVNKVLYTGHSGYRVVYVDRSPNQGARLKSVEARRIARVTGWALYLDDDWTVIPLHRVVEIRDEEGRVVWRRSGVKGTEL